MYMLICNPSTDILFFGVRSYVHERYMWGLYTELFYHHRKNMRVA